MNEDLSCQKFVQGWPGKAVQADRDEKKKERNLNNNDRLSFMIGSHVRWI